MAAAAILDFQNFHFPPIFRMHTFFLRKIWKLTKISLRSQRWLQFFGIFVLAWISPLRAFLERFLWVDDPQMEFHTILTPKRHFLQRNDVIWRLDRENRPIRLVGRRGEENTKKVTDKPVIFHPFPGGRRKGWWIKNCKGRGLHDVIACAKCHFNRFIGGLSCRGGRKSHFHWKADPPLTLCLALPCCTWWTMPVL